jgi:hypothetical protein
VALIVTAFTLARGVTLSLAALNLVSPPARVIEPAIALSIVYVGADDLLKREGRDLGAWIAFGFGLIHGFGFANVLREMALPPRALGWSLFSFSVGVEIGQILVVSIVATALAALRQRHTDVNRQVAFVWIRPRDRGRRVLVHRTCVLPRRWGLIRTHTLRQWSFSTDRVAMDRGGEAPPCVRAGERFGRVLLAVRIVARDRVAVDAGLGLDLVILPSVFALDRAFHRMP